MEIFGVGPSELFFVIIIAVIILGPKDMQKAGKMLGKWMRDIVTSDGWKMFQQTSHELKTLPNKLMREANEEVNKLGNELNNSISPALRKGEGDSSWMKNPNISRVPPVPTSPAVPRPAEKAGSPQDTESKSVESAPQQDA